MPNPATGSQAQTFADVNTDADPLDPGIYCFAPIADLTNYDRPTKGDRTEVGDTMAKIPTTTVTSPVDGDRDAITSVTIGTLVYDHAVVKELHERGRTPTGTVTFYLRPDRGPSGPASAKDYVDDPNGESGEATPATMRARTTRTARCKPRAQASQSTRTAFGASASTRRPGTRTTRSDDATRVECFEVTATSSAVSRQRWLHERQPPGLDGRRRASSTAR